MSKLTEEEERALRAMTDAGRAFIALHPEIDVIKLTFFSEEHGLQYIFYIHSAEREWELRQAAERERRELEEQEALRRARREPETKPVTDDGPWSW
jgi:1,4-alpha-glucan branching enzyme